MSSSRICLAAVIAATALPVSTAAAMPPDLHGIHHRATTADVERTPPAKPSHEFPWIETAGLAALVAVAGASTARRRRSVPA